MSTKKKHTLDSDEEDEVDHTQTGNKVLRDDDIDGQEDGCEDYEGETTITPFNMKDEMDEGHFDGDGFYRFQKESNDLKDPWLEDIDWAKVKQAENKYGSDSEEEKSDSDEEMPPSSSEGASLAIYRQILPSLKPAETVAKAIKRLGGGKRLSSAQKWKLKRLQKSDEKKSSGDDNLQNMLALTELANQIIEQGNMDVYSETYEMIAEKIRRVDNPPAAMDMFADESTNGKDGNIGEQPDGIEEVRWEIKLKNDETSEVQGPFTSAEMAKKQEQGDLDGGAYVRKKETSSNGDWYQAKRIDFDLYV